MDVLMIIIIHVRAVSCDDTHRKSQIADYGQGIPLALIHNTRWKINAEA